MAVGSSRSGTLRISVVTDDKQAQRGLDNVNKRLAVFGAAAAAAVAAMAASSVKSFAEFDSAMTQSVAIAGDVSDVMRRDMSDAAREMGKTTVFSATQAAEAYFFLASAGLDVEQSIAALPVVAAFAQAGMFDMARATDLLTDAQSALGLSVDDAQQNLANMTRVGDVLVKANTLANASVEEFAESLTTKAGAALRQHNIEVESGVAVLATFADQGLKGSAAGTILARTIEGIAQKAPQLDQLGVSVFDASGEMNNMADITAQLEDRFEGMSTEQRNAELASIGFNERTRQGILLMLGNSDAIREYESELQNAGGTMETIAERQLQTMSAQWGLLRDRMKDVSIEVGSRLAPVLENLIGFGIGLFDSFDSLDGSMQTVIITAGIVSAAGLGLAGAFVAARAAVKAFRIEMTALATKTGILGVALLGIGAAIGTIVAKQQEARARTEELTMAIEADSGAIGENTREFARNELVKDGAIAAARALGVNVDDLTDAYLGNTDALARVEAQAGFAVDGMRGLAAEGRQGADAAAGQAAEWEVLQDALGRGGKAMEGVARTGADLADQGLRLKDTMSEVEHETRLAQVATARWEGQAKTAGATLGDAANTVDDYSGSVEDAESALRSFTDAMREQVDPIFALIKAEERMNDVLADSEASTLDQAAAVLDYQSAVADAEGTLSNRMDPAMRNLLRSAGMTDDAIASLAGQMQGAQGRARTLASSFQPVERRADAAARKIGDVDGHLRRIPRQVRTRVITEFTTSGFARARSQIARIAGDARATRYFHDGGMVHHGGIVGHDGPMLRHDEVPAILQTGELVLSRLDVAALQDVFRNMPRVHDGGLVGPSGTIRPTPAAAGGHGECRHVLEIRSSGRDEDDLLVERLRRAVTERGGDVQTVIGRNG